MDLSNAILSHRISLYSEYSFHQLILAVILWSRCFESLRAKLSVTITIVEISASCFSKKRCSRPAVYWPEGCWGVTPSQNCYSVFEVPLASKTLNQVEQGYSFGKFCHFADQNSFLFPVVSTLICKTRFVVLGVIENSGAPCCGHQLAHLK